MTLDVVILIEDVQQYIAEAEQLVTELPNSHSELFGGDFTYLANGTNLISFKNDLFEVMNGFVDFTKDSIDKYDDIITNICNNLFTVRHMIFIAKCKTGRDTDTTASRGPFQLDISVFVD